MNDKELYLLTFWGLFWITGILAIFYLLYCAVKGSKDFIRLYKKVLPQRVPQTYNPEAMFRDRLDLPSLPSPDIEEASQEQAALEAFGCMGRIELILAVVVFVVTLLPFVPELIGPLPNPAAAAIIFTFIVMVQSGFGTFLTNEFFRRQEQNILLKRSGHRRPPIKQGNMFIWDDRRNPDSYDEW